MIRVLLVDDHTLFRQAVSGQIRSVDGIDVVGETGSGRRGVELAEKLDPDVVVMDISLPDINGIDAVKAIRRKNLNTRIVILSMYKYPGLMEMGVEIDGYLIKNDAFDELVYALKAVHEGRQYISPSLIDSTMEPVAPSLSLLSLREREILVLISEGLNSREIAEKLCISVKTVETHRANIMKKMDAKNVAEMIKRAIRWGIIDV